MMSSSLCANSDSTSSENDPLIPDGFPPPYYDSLERNKPYTPPPSYQDIIKNCRERQSISPPSSGHANVPSDHKILCAISFFCCCCSPLACIALYYSQHVQDEVKNGNMTAAKRSSRKACCLATLSIFCNLVLVGLILGGTFAACYEIHSCSNEFKSLFH